jgi:integrase
MGRRSNGEGNVRKRPDGRWEARLHWEDPETGEMHRQSFYAPTATAVRAKLKKARERLEEGAPVKDASRTVADWLAQWRITTLAASDRRISTRELYATLSRKHLEAEPFGAIRLDRLRPSDIDALVLSMRAKMKPGRGEGADPVRALADATIRQVYTVLRAGLDGAVRDGLLAKNPAAAVRRPGVARREARHLERADVDRLLDHAAGSRYHAALILIARTGLRRGEALGLTWDRVDLSAGTLVVAGTLSRVGKALVVSEPKTARSRRELPLATAVVEVLRKQRAAQAAERLRAGDQWADTGLVFTTELGAAVDPRNLLRVVETSAKAAGLPDVDVHTLRHSAAVELMGRGAHIKLVADLLGHSSIAVTGDIYGHTSQGAAREALESLAGPAVKK